MTNKDIVNRYLVELNLKCCIGPLGRKINVTGRRRHHLRTKIHAQKKCAFLPVQPTINKGCPLPIWFVEQQLPENFLPATHLACLLQKAQIY
jgi:hypothetical protein